MKKWKKVVAAAAAVLAVVASTAVFAGCSGGAAAVTDVYSANPSSEGTAMYLTSPMQMIVVSEETITSYDDNTYCLSVSYTAITGLTAITTGGNEEVINRGTTILEYYGSCTAIEDSGITVLTLSSPERMTISNTDSLMTGGLPVGYFDTDNWTTSEEMTTWWTGMAGGSGDCTGEAVLEKFAFDETDVAVSADGTFDYLKYGYHYVILSGMLGLN